MGDERLTYVALLDRSKKQKKARTAAFEAGSDAAVVARCVDALTASRPDTATPAEGTATPAEGALPGWTRRAPVVPAALAGLLPEDFTAKPLAQPDPVGPAARTSGTGDLVSAPFSVSSGPWLAELDAVTCETWEGALRDATDPERAFPLEGTREYLYELDGGHYYWDVTAPGCDWSVDLAPVVLGPEPTPTPDPRVMVPPLSGASWDRSPNAPNPEFLDAYQARQTVLAAGLTTGECTEQGGGTGDRVWQQQPIPGSLVEKGTPVNIWIHRDCDMYRGDRVPVE